MVNVQSAVAPYIRRWQYRALHTARLPVWVAALGLLVVGDFASILTSWAPWAITASLWVTSVARLTGLVVLVALGWVAIPRTFSRAPRGGSVERAFDSLYVDLGLVRCRCSLLQHR